ncbi:hypothetical protein ACFQ7B_32685 [Streptomyces erythrochromogenes]|uniref:hypothetical protein n=1 Tax=Streptomyces erythrochromogenes TaxID=285574 RepID=UPI00367B08F1
MPAAEFLRWVFAGRVVSHRRRAPVRSRLPAWGTVWTAPQYADAETAYLDAEERRKREQAERERALLLRRRKEQQLQREQERARAESGHKAAVQALLARQAALEIPVAEFVHRETGSYPLACADTGARPVPPFVTALQFRPAAPRSPGTGRPSRPQPRPGPPGSTSTASPPPPP